MSIDRIAVQKIIDKIPRELRNAARIERKIVVDSAKSNPISTSIEAAYGKFDFSNNIELQAKIRELNKKLAEDAYKSIYHRQPTGFMSQCDNMPDVVKASMNLE